MTVVQSKVVAFEERNFQPVKIELTGVQISYATRRLGSG
jgi:hypothetical protein